MIRDQFDFEVTDTDTGVTYHPWTNGWAIGYEVHHPGGPTEFIYLNPSSDGGGDPEHTSNVFVYRGTEADPAADAPQHFYDLDTEAAANHALLHREWQRQVTVALQRGRPTNSDTAVNDDTEAEVAATYTFVVVVDIPYDDEDVKEAVEEYVHSTVDPFANPVDVERI